MYRALFQENAAHLVPNSFGLTASFRICRYGREPVEYVGFNIAAVYFIQFIRPEKDRFHQERSIAHRTQQVTRVDVVFFQYRLVLPKQILDFVNRFRCLRMSHFPVYRDPAFAVRPYH